MRALMLASMCSLILAAPAEAARKYRLLVKSNPEGASIYTGSKNSGVLGTTPHRLYLPRGKNIIILELPGYKTLTQVVQLQRNTAMTFTLVKEVARATIRLTLAGPADAAGTSVTVDGHKHGALPAQVQVVPGRHLLEVSRADHKTWRQWVDLKQGESKTVVVTLVATRAREGALLVSCPTSGAEILVDGKAAGGSPALVQKLAVGAHTVSVKAPDHKPAAKTVTIEEGQTTRLAVNLEPLKVAPTGGTLQVLSEPAQADIYVDGKFVGKAPVKVEALAEGTHVLEGKQAGRVTAELPVMVKNGQHTTVKIKLRAEVKEAPRPAAAAHGLLKINGLPAGSSLQVDGVPASWSPEGLKLAPGSHQVTVTRQGYQPYKATVAVTAGATMALAVEMKPAPASQPASKPATPASQPVDKVDTRGLSSFGAQLIPPRYFTADVSGGWTYLAEARLTTGVFSKGHLGLDVSVELKTYGAMTELGMATKFRFLVFEPIALAAFVGLGGGGGPSSRDTFYFNGGVLFSLMFKKILTFTGRLYLNYYTDRLCASEAKTDELDVCVNPDPNLNLGQSPRDRFAAPRFILSALLEVPVTDWLGIFGMVEGAPGQAQRRAFTDPFFELFPKSDARIYGRAGVTFKF